MMVLDPLHRELIVVDPAAHTPETDCFNHISRLSPIRASYHLPGICGPATLALANQRAAEGQIVIAGIIVLGSASSVHDQLLWQLELAKWLRPHIEHGVPFFGFCFGHQLLAHMHGAKVGFVRHDQEKLTGFYPVEMKQSRLASASTLSLLRSHREAVIAAPAGFSVIATSSEVAVDGLEHDSLPIWSLQTHPEATSGFLVNQGIDTPLTAAVSKPESATRTRDGWTLVKAFLDHCR